MNVPADEVPQEWVDVAVQVHDAYRHSPDPMFTEMILRQILAEVYPKMRLQIIGELWDSKVTLEELAQAKNVTPVQMAEELEGAVLLTADELADLIEVNSGEQCY